MPELKASPRVNPKTGAVADFLKYLKSPQSSQQMQGLMSVLPFVDDLETTLDRVSYGEPLTTGQGMTTALRPEAKGMVELATMFAPGGRAASQAAESGAMALGRAGEQYAERKVPEVMARGGRPAQLLSDLAKGTISPATVFHGSPHRFTKFDSSKIGTGEGNQTYGYGLYLAENPAVANDYKRQLSSEFFWRDLDAALPTALKGKAPDWTDALLSGKTVDDLASTLKRPWEKSLLQQNKAKIESVIDAHKASGNLYQVDLPDVQIAKMLDYDKPLSQQAPEIKAKLKAVVDDQMGAGIWDKWLKTSPDFKNLENDLFEDKAPQEISALLRQAGISGIRYLDQNSRATPNITNKRLADLYEKYQGNAEAAVDEMMRSVYNTPKKKAEMREQFMKQLQTQTPKTSNFVVFPGMEDTLRIEKINDSPLDLFLQNYKP
jgi:hypothetical protein